MSTEQWLSDINFKASEAFQAVGLPRFKDEMWKYTNPANFIKHSKPIFSEDSAQVELDVQDFDAHHISFVDGKLNQTALENLQVEGLKVSLVNGSEKDLDFHTQSFLKQGDGFQLLSLSSVRELLYIEVLPKVKIEKPIVLHFVESGQFKTSGMLSPVCLVSLGENASANFVEYQYSIASSANWTQPLTSYRQARGSQLQLLKMISTDEQAQLLSFTNLQQDRDTQANVLSIMSSGKVLRNILNVEQEGEGAFCSANGLSLVKAGEHFDVRARFLHLKPHGTSQQLYKSVVSEKARFVFNGKIYIAPDAQKVDSQMVNKNLLLGRLAEADTKPELEVYADDVKAGHGASIGQLDTSELFYLMSRGISKRRSLELLARAYVDELVLSFPNEELRAWINRKLALQLQALSKQIEATLDSDATESREV